MSEPSTIPLYYDDAYQTEASSKITEIDTAQHRISLDQSLFYPLGGGQPGDHGQIIRADGEVLLEIIDTIKDKDSGQVWHIVDANQATELSSFNVGDRIDMNINWVRRHAHMRMHTCLHLLCSVIDAPVTGGSISADKARLDFVLPEAPDKAMLTEKLNALIAANHSRTIDWITDAELEAQPDLVRTMSVKPPMGSGKVRLINLKDVDLQPCGGTHVKATGEIGPVEVRKIENKGKNNRRITVVPV